MGCAACTCETTELNGAYINDGSVQEMTFGQGAEAMDMGQSGLAVDTPSPKAGRQRASRWRVQHLTLARHSNRR